MAAFRLRVELVSPVASIHRRQRVFKSGRAVVGRNVGPNEEVAHFPNGPEAGDV
jgi:hypothetical protein